MGKHKDRAKKQKARSSGRKHKYGTDSYDTGSSEFSGDDSMDYQAFPAGYGRGGTEDMEKLARAYVNEQSSTCGRITSALSCLVTLALSMLAIAWANTHGTEGVDCGEQNPLNVSYFNWLIILGVCLFAVFLMQLLVSLLACCTKPEWDTLPTKAGSPLATKVGARRIACASFMIMIMGSLLLTWLIYGLWVLVPAFEIESLDPASPDQRVKPTRANEESFASPECFQLHQFSFILEMVGLAYVFLYIISQCCCGVGFCSAMSLLKRLFGGV